MQTLVVRPYPDVTPALNRQLVERGTNGSSGANYFNLLCACREDLKEIQTLIQKIDYLGEHTFDSRYLPVKLINLTRLERRYGKDVANEIVDPLWTKMASVPGWRATQMGFPEYFGSTRLHYWFTVVRQD